MADYNDCKFVLDRLKMQLLEENHFIKIIEGYEYNYNDRPYFFDLVEINGNGDISKIYEIKSKSAVDNNPGFIRNQLSTYQRITEAEVYLVYLEDDGNLKILPYSDIPTRRRLSLRETSSFSSFYSRIKLICNNKGNFFFRGHSNYNYETIPSIYRNDNIQNEARFYHEAIRRNPTEFTEDMSTFDKLVKMQHYELPTRLLDITTNPLVALYFACQGSDKVDGEVLIYSMQPEQIEYYDSDAICKLSNIAKCSKDFSLKADNKFTDNKDSLVSYIKQDKPSFNGNLEPKDLDQVLCVMPKLNNDRIIRQHGAFFIYGMGISKETPAELLDKPRKIRIKGDSKKDILKELELLGINDAELFPETDKIMKHIKNNIQEDRLFSQN